MAAAAGHHPAELDSGTDSVTSTPRSLSQNDHHQPRVRFMCSFGGKILPRPHDNQLRYVGGDTKIVAVSRTTTFSALLSKLSKLAGTAEITVKYQLPSEDLDALITVTSDEDVENMMEEFERLVVSQNNRNARLRLFLFPNGSSTDNSRASSISSLLDGSTKRENWFLDILNGGPAPASAGGGGGCGGDSACGLERGQSEASSIVSEVPDYLFGLDNSDEAREPKLKNRPCLHDAAYSDPNSPNPVSSSASPFNSASSAPCIQSMPNLPPVKTKPDSPVGLVLEQKESPHVGFVETGEPVIQQPTGYTGNPVWTRLPASYYPGHPIQPMPVPLYYVASSGAVPRGNARVQSVPISGPYVQQYQLPGGQVAQVPVGFHQVVSGSGPVYSRPAAMDPYDVQARVAPLGTHQPVYYGAANGPMGAGYPGAAATVPRNEVPGSTVDSSNGRVAQT
ncbi:hypothetical protein Ancab_033710 [Ancistrocladus abbreviatus]